MGARGVNDGSVEHDQKYHKFFTSNKEIID